MSHLRYLERFWQRKDTISSLGLLLYSQKAGKAIIMTAYDILPQTALQISPASVDFNSTGN